MIWALLALYLFGSAGASPLAGAFEHAKTAIKTDIHDKERQKELLAIVDAAERATKDEASARLKAAKKIEDISEHHRATRANIDAELSLYGGGIEEYQDRMIKLRFDLKARMTREEWAKVFSASGGR